MKESEDRARNSAASSPVRKRSSSELRTAVDPASRSKSRRVVTPGSESRECSNDNTNAEVSSPRRLFASGSNDNPATGSSNNTRATSTNHHAESTGRPLSSTDFQPDQTAERAEILEQRSYLDKMLREVRPGKKKANWCLLRVLAATNEKLSKAQLKQRAEVYFGGPMETKGLTNGTMGDPWSYIKTLEHKKLVKRHRSKEAYFWLTAQGWKFCDELFSKTQAAAQQNVTREAAAGRQSSLSRFFGPK